ncbi:MAG: Rpp14/Pop5 family protein [Candidatus Woesearchaeota archaeon]
MAGEKRIKLLPPTQREKFRYIAFKIEGQREPISYEEFSSAFSKEFEKLFGRIEMGRANPVCLRERFNPEAGTGIIRVERSGADKVRAVFAASTIRNAQVRSLKVSGSIRKAKMATEE